MAIRGIRRGAALHDGRQGGRVVRSDPSVRAPARRTLPPRGASHRRAPDLDRGATAARGDAERDAVDAVAAALILETWLCEHGAA